VCVWIWFFIFNKRWTKLQQKGSAWL